MFNSDSCNANNVLQNTPFFASYYNRGSKYDHCISYFWQEVIFLQFLTIALTVIFFNKLIQTENQFYHGLTTLFASSGIIFLYLAIELAANG